MAGLFAGFAASPAQAQFYTNGPGFFLSLEGRYAWGNGSDLPNYAYAINGGSGNYRRYRSPHADGGAGPGGRLGLGYRFANNWDVGVAVAGGRNSSKDSAHSYDYSNPSTIVDDKLKTALNYTNIDFEAGYNVPIAGGANLRLFGGLRFAYYRQNAKGTVTNVDFAGGYHDYNGERKTRYYGLGPRIGANGTLPLGSSGLHLFGGLSFAVLAGHLTDKHHFSYDSTGGGASGGSFSYTDHKKSKLAINGEGEVGLGYNFAMAGGPAFGLQIGYRGEALSGAASTGFVNGWYLTGTNQPKPVGDHILHGPFVRMIASFGGGTAAAAASAPAPDAAGKMPVAFTAEGQRPLYTAPAGGAGGAGSGGGGRASDGTLIASTAPMVAATPPDATTPALLPGWFGTLSGWYVTDAGDDRTVLRNFFGFDFLRGGTHPGNGWGGKAYAGYRFADLFDVALGVQGTRLNRHKQAFPNAVSRTDADYWAADAELGYNMVVSSGGALRVFGGLRYAQFRHHTTFDRGFDLASYDNDYWGIGPRVGADFNVRLGSSGFSVFGDVAGSALFGKLAGKHQFEGCAMSTDCTYHAQDTRMVWNGEAQLGLAYEVAPGVNLGVGYRIEYWNGVADASFYLLDEVIRSGRSDRVMHGPFARIAYNFGPPVAVRAAMAPPPPPKPGVANSFIVFFDFDRSNITAQAQATINDAVAAAKAGNSTRITLTGHTDRSGSEQYNQALSIRRGEAVKAAMIRGGIPASAIVVIGKGESAPLVPTPDGVREPQNRRVEIVI